MKRFFPTFGIVLAAGLTLASGLIHGRMSNRWGLPEDLLAIGEKLQGIPDSFPGTGGDWQLESSGELSDGEIEVLECAGHVVRTYVHRETGDKVNMALLVGPAMPISLHTAEICWDAMGHTILGERQRVKVLDSGGSDQEFWALTFQTNDIKRDEVRVYYGWSDGNRWSEQTERRLSLTRRRHLYKIEVVSRGTEADDSCQRFLRDFAPVAARYLAAASDE